MEELDQFTVDLFKKDCTFVMGVAKLDQLPPQDRLEVGFIGRSNVGKSSLINAVLRRTHLARTSNTPGRTQELNFFNLADKLFIVDMPGYGYAQVSKSKVDAWTRLMKDYLRGRSTLYRVFLLLDSRHEIKTSDIDMMKMLNESAVSYQLVLTKSDKIKPSLLQERQAALKDLIKNHPAAYPDIILTSAVTKDGLDDVRKAIALLLYDKG